MKKTFTILFILASLVSFGQAKHKEKFGVYKFMDSVYFGNIPYSASASIVHLGIDTLITSPTYGKLVRKTASAATPGIDAVLAVGQALTANRTIDVGSSDLIISQSGIFTSTFGSSGSGLVSSSSTNAGLYGISTTNVAGVVGENSDNTTAPIQSQKNLSNTHISSPTLFLLRTTSGTAINGIGQKIMFGVETSTGAQDTSATIESYLKNATNANKTGQFAVRGVTNSVIDTAMVLGGYVDLTESSATTFTSTTIASSKIQGGTILITIEANNGTEFQARTMRFIWVAENKAGTMAITLSTPEEVVAASTGTLTCTITGTDAGSGVLKFNANATSSLTQTVLRCSYQTFKNF
jgi:hypothetical protein